MKIEAYAKVNLTLEVLGERVDGFHALRSLVAPITLADTLDVEPADSIETDSGYGQDDLCCRAALALGVGAKFSLVKRIPAGGGLGGGSADAAAALRALNEIYRLGHSVERLAEIGAGFGSDIPALVLAQHYRRGVMMEGRGEIVHLSDPLEPASLILVNPKVHSATAEVFAAFRRSFFPEMLNDLERPAISLHPEIGQALTLLRSFGAERAMMSGSGSTVFGFVRDAAAARELAGKIRARGYDAWTATFLV